MKIVITGSTGGLGNSLVEIFREHNLVCLDRVNGYDLDKNLDDFILDDFDVYINNAYSGFQQTNLLYKLFEKNKDRYCIIINIGSVSSDGNKDYINQYAINKASLEKTCLQLQLIDSECKVSLIKLGRMNTKMVADRIGYPKMDPNYVANSIKWLVEQPKNIVIKNLTIDQQHSNKIIES